MRLLHLSNLKQFYDRGGLDLARFVKDKAGSCFQGLIVSNCTENGSEAELKMAAKFLLDIMNELLILPAQTILLPGRNDLEKGPEFFNRYCYEPAMEKPFSTETLQHILLVTGGKSFQVLGMNAAKSGIPESRFKIWMKQANEICGARPIRAIATQEHVSQWEAHPGLQDAFLFENLRILFHGNTHIEIPWYPFFCICAGINAFNILEWDPEDICFDVGAYKKTLDKWIYEPLLVTKTHFLDMAAGLARRQGKRVLRVSRRQALFQILGDLIREGHHEAASFLLEYHGVGLTQPLDTYCLDLVDQLTRLFIVKRTKENGNDPKCVGSFNEERVMDLHSITLLENSELYTLAELKPFFDEVFCMYLPHCLEPDVSNPIPKWIGRRVKCLVYLDYWQRPKDLLKRNRRLENILLLKNSPLSRVFTKMPDGQPDGGNLPG